MAKDEKIASAIVKIIIGAAMLVFLLLGWVIPPKDDFSDKLWGAVHPTTVLDIIGAILFVLAGVGLSGVLPKTILPAKSISLPLLTFAAGALGVILMFI